MRTHYRDYGSSRAVQFTFLCCACSQEFNATTPTMHCPRCEDGPYGEMSGS